jgi:hypothetical protein
MMSMSVLHGSGWSHEHPVMEPYMFKHWGAQYCSDVTVSNCDPPPPPPTPHPHPHPTHTPFCADKHPLAVTVLGGIRQSKTTTN